MTRTLALAVAVALMRSGAPGAPGAAPQARPTPPPAAAGDRVAIGSADVSRYEVMYGSPEFRTLDEDAANWPFRTAIRTVGTLETIPGRGQSGAASPPSPGLQGQGRVGLWDNPLARYRICGERTACVAMVPVEEMAGVFDGPAHDWIHRKIEVIGAIDEMRMQGNRSIAFQVWSVFEAPEMPSRKKDGSKGSSLEPLVRYPKSAEGTVVTVTGVFRGANLFEDLPPESRRDDSDWVLQDGPFSIWVTGRAPNGKGFSLDPRSRSDCRYRLEATGKVAIANGFIYLRASGLQLLGRAKEE